MQNKFYIPRQYFHRILEVKISYFSKKQRRFSKGMLILYIIKSAVQRGKEKRTNFIPQYSSLLLKTAYISWNLETQSESWRASTCGAPLKSKCLCICYTFEFSVCLLMYLFWIRLNCVLGIKKQKTAVGMKLHRTRNYNIFAFISGVCILIHEYFLNSMINKKKGSVV